MNEPVDAADLPRLDDAHFVPVHPNLLRISLWGRALVAAVVLVVGIVVSVVMSDGRWVPLVVMAALLVVLALSAVLRIVEVRNIAYQVRTHDLSYRSGVLVKTVSTVPFVRVQHARIRQGPLQRRFGLVTLDVNSAGPDLHIDGLARSDADRLSALAPDKALAEVIKSDTEVRELEIDFFNMVANELKATPAEIIGLSSS